MPGKEIYITIEDNTGQPIQIGSAKESLTAQEAQNRISPSSATGIEGKQKSKGVAIAAMVAQRSFSYVTSNIGKWTGNSQNQQKVNNVMQVASLGMLAIINPYVAITSVALSLATTAIDEAYDRKWNIKAVTQAQARAGYSSTDEVVGRRH